MRRLVIVAALCALSLGGADPPSSSTMPGPAPIVRSRSIDAVKENATCEGCHADIAKEWQGSLHHTAFTDRDFQRQLASEPEAFCRGCHAPEADPAKTPSKELGELGIGCVSCHVVGASVPHAKKPAVATDAACARCHEFAFPTAQAAPGSMMQKTVSEHAALGRSDTCASCHMSKRSGHADHAFAASRSSAMLTSAVSVDAKRAGSAVTVTLTTSGVGHSFPTGDLFRRVRVVAETDGARRERVLGRVFRTREVSPGVLARVETSDDRIGSTPKTLTFDLGAAAEGHPIRVRVIYERGEGPGGAVMGAVELFSVEVR